MPTFSVRSVYRWSPRTDQKKRYLYEERITLWNTRSLTKAIDLAEREADEYAGADQKFLGLLQGYWMVDECKLKKQGIEVFSLLRESDLPPKSYVRAFFDTGCERQGEYDSPMARASARSPTRSPQNRARSKNRIR